MSTKSVKRPDSNRTERAKFTAISRKSIRKAYSKNGGRF